MEDKIYNVVTVKHQNDNTPYTFRVSQFAMLRVGDYVLCDTKRGPNQMARCITPSFLISESSLRDLYNIAPNNLKSVTAQLTPVAMLIEKEE